MELIEKLCHYGYITFELSEIGYALVFEPYSDSTLPSHMKSTVLIARETPADAVNALDQYINKNKHWSEYASGFFTGEI